MYMVFYLRIKGRGGEIERTKKEDARTKNQEPRNKKPRFFRAGLGELERFGDPVKVF
jgi:hypothetical protein